MRNTEIRLMARSVADQVNTEIFGGRLHRVTIHTKPQLRRENTYGLFSKGQIWLYVNQLKECGKFLPQQVFAIIAHEMIHHAQFCFNLRGLDGERSYAHNNAFFRFYAKKIQAAYGHKIAAMQERYEENV